MFLIIEDNVKKNELEEFYGKNINFFLNVAFLKLKNRNDAEDAVQEAFYEIVRNPDYFFGIAPENRIAIVAAVVRNISSDMFNKKNKVRLEELNPEDFYDDDSLSLEDSVIGIISRDKLKQLIQSLPVLQRDVLTLRCLIGLSTAETAEKLNISPSAVKKRLHLAKEALRKCVWKESDIYE